MNAAFIVVLLLIAGIFVPAELVKDAIADSQRDRRQRRERRSGRTIGQHLKSVERSLEVTKEAAGRKALQARMEHLHERVIRFVPRKQTDRRHSSGTDYRAFLPRISLAAILASALRLNQRLDDPMNLPQCVTCAVTEPSVDIFP